MFIERPHALTCLVDRGAATSTSFFAAGVKDLRWHHELAAETIAAGGERAVRGSVPRVRRQDRGPDRPSEGASSLACAQCQRVWGTGEILLTG